MDLLKKKNDFKMKLIFKDDMMKFTEKEILLYIQIMKEKMLNLKLLMEKKSIIHIIV